MNPRLSLAPIVLLVVAGCSGGGSPTAPTAAVPTFRLTGAISDASAGIPLSGITVSVLGEANAVTSVVTGPDGRYALSSLVRDAVTLRTRHNGYEDHVQDITVTQDTNIDIRLIPRRSVSSGWTAGQLYFTAEGTRAGSRVSSIQLSQSGTTVTGTFSTAEGNSGTFTGRVEGTTFIGSLRTEFVVGARLDRRCRGFSPTAGGVVTPDSVTIRADTMVFENCAGAATNVELTLQP